MADVKRIEMEDIENESKLGTKFCSIVYTDFGLVAFKNLYYLGGRIMESIRVSEDVGFYCTCGKYMGKSRPIGHETAIFTLTIYGERYLLLWHVCSIPCALKVSGCIDRKEIMDKILIVVDVACNGLRM